MKITWLHTGDDNRSHFKDVSVPLNQEGAAMRSPLFPGPGAAFSETAAGGSASAFHHAPRRQWVVVLSGYMDVEIGDGTVRRFNPGEVFLADDLTGEGHAVRPTNGTRCIMTVPVESALDPRGWAAAG